MQAARGTIGWFWRERPFTERPGNGGKWVVGSREFFALTNGGYREFGT